MFTIVTPYLPGFVRSAGLLSMLLPNLGYGGVIRISLTAMILSLALPAADQPVNLIFLVGDFAIGILLGLPAALAIAAAGQYGELIDVLRGQTLGSILDPLSRASVAPLAMLYRFWFWVAILVQDLLLGLAQNVAVSLGKISAASLIQADMYQLGRGIVTASLMQLSMLIESLAPILAMIFGVELVAMAMAKLIPQINLQAETYLLKMLAIFVLLASRYETGLDWPLAVAGCDLLEVIR